MNTADDMNRVSVDIGGTFTDCFVAWAGRHVQAKALTTHHNLATGFNEALALAVAELGISTRELLSAVDSVRYATTLGTNALIERRGPRIGLLVTAGFDSTVPLSRARGHGDGLSFERQHDVPRARRPDPLVPTPLIRAVRERIGYNGAVLMAVDDEDVRRQLRALVDEGAETVVVSLTNSVVNPRHELRVRELFLEEYPGHFLGAVPMLLAHQVAGRKGEYTRSMSAIVDGFLHNVMYHGLGALEMSLRANGYAKPMLINHNSGGMAQLNSSDALQTVHSGPVAGIAASEHLSLAGGLGNVIATDMGGTSFDIGIVTADGERHYDFNPVIDRWLVSIPMVHLVTLGAGGGSIASYDPLLKRVKIGPESAGSNPGPACYSRGGRAATVTDADLLLGYLDPDNYARGRIKLNTRRAERAMQDAFGQSLNTDVIGASRIIKHTVDHTMANGIATELRARGYTPDAFTMLAYGGNGPLHACGIASALGVTRVLVPPFSSVFSALGAGNVDQLHIHEQSIYTVVFHTVLKKVLTDYAPLNATIEALKQRGREDLTRQGVAVEDIRYRVEFDMRYGNQRAETAVTFDIDQFRSVNDVLALIAAFHRRYGERFGAGSQASEAGVRINTVRVSSFVERAKVKLGSIMPPAERLAVEACGERACHFIGVDAPLATRLYDERALVPGSAIDGPAIVTTAATTYLIEPGWQFHAAEQGAAWLTRIEPTSTAS